MGLSVIIFEEEHKGKCKNRIQELEPQKVFGAVSYFQL